MSFVTSYPLTAWDILKHKWDLAGPMYQMDVPVSQILLHDYSKFSPSILPAYADFFHGERTPEVVAAFKEAYRKHWATEPHHWHQRPDVWGKVEDKPLRYRLETLADTYGAAKRKSTDPNFPDFKSWYAMNKNKFAPKDLQAIVDAELGKTASVLSDLLSKSEEQSKVIKQIFGSERYEKEMQLAEIALRKKSFIPGAATKLKDLAQ